MATLPERHEELVKVFDTDQESEAMVVQGLLESEGIESVLVSLEAPQDVLPGVGGITLQVRAEQADQARNFIEEYRKNGPADADAAEADSETEFNEEPPA